MYGLPRHSDIKGKKTDNQSKVDVDRFDVTRYVVKRPSKEVDGKSYYKVISSPVVQQLTLTRPLMSREWLLPREEEERLTRDPPRSIRSRKTKNCSRPTLRNSELPLPTNFGQS